MKKIASRRNYLRMRKRAGWSDYLPNLDDYVPDSGGMDALGDYAEDIAPSPLAGEGGEDLANIARQHLADAYDQAGESMAPSQMTSTGKAYYTNEANPAHVKEVQGMLGVQQDGIIGDSTARAFMGNTGQGMPATFQEFYHAVKSLF